ncbi:MAG: sigma-54-dependent transcriptional regulator [Planctomycetota bacterium]|jgi:DNA-binding NtrC family response regulator
MAEFDSLRVLVVDDEDDVRLGLRMLAESVTREVRAASDGEEALAIAHDWCPHLVVSDITMGRMSGMDLLAELRGILPATRVILVTGFGTIELAVAAMGLGASHFVTKPFDNEDLLTSIRRFGREALLDESEKAHPSRSKRAFIAEDPAMKEVIARIDQVAPTAMTVLIRGASGVGKELVARTIHERSKVAKKPFLAVNTAALPDTLIESELFGHRKGAFTGADRARKGIFEQAKGGTVFLDEIGLMSLGFQGKLLRVLQERMVVPLGSVEPIPVDFRLVAATSRNLSDLMAKGEFHEDLYYRLQVFTLEVPSLRDRPSDIQPLAAHLLAKYAEGSAKLSEEAVAALQSHAWPGNVRELENSIQRAVVLSGGRPIVVADLGLGQAESRVVIDANLTYEEGKRRTVEQFQRRFIERALSECDGNVTAAARECGLTRAALQRIMRTLGLDRNQFRSN